MLTGQSLGMGMPAWDVATEQQHVSREGDAPFSSHHGMAPWRCFAGRWKFWSLGSLGDYERTVEAEAKTGAQVTVHLGQKRTPQAVSHQR